MAMFVQQLLLALGMTGVCACARARACVCVKFGTEFVNVATHLQAWQ
jgi:hypothetical protein